MPLTRREFVSTATAGAAGLALGVDAGPRPGRSVLGGILVGVQSFTFRQFDVDRMIAAMKSVGLGSIELWDGHLDPLKAGPDQFRSVRRRLDEAGIAVNAYCVNFPTDASEEHLDRAFRGAGLLGTNVMTSSVEKPLLDRLDRCCRKYRVRLGLHNHYLGDPWFKGDKALNFESPADFITALEGRSEYLSLNLDIGHFFAAGHDPVAFFREHHRRIVSLHLKDRDKDAARSDRPFGEGATPIAAVLETARQVRFRGAANIEYELDAPDPTEGVRRAFAYVKRALKA